MAGVATVGLHCRHRRTADSVTFIGGRKDAAANVDVMMRPAMWSKSLTS